MRLLNSYFLPTHTILLSNIINYSIYILVSIKISIITYYIIFKYFLNIFKSFNQFSSYRYFVSKYSLIFFNISVKIDIFILNLVKIEVSEINPIY